MLILKIKVEFLCSRAWTFMYTCMHAQSLSHVRLFVTPMDYSLPGSSVLGTLQARILEWVAISFPGDLPHPQIEPASHVSPALWADSIPAKPLGKPHIYEQ